jgi:hypothetical protein
MNTSDLGPGAIFALFKGYPNSGKSIASGSFPNPFIFDFDRKIRVMKNYYPEKNFEYIQPDDIPDVKKQLRELKKSCPYKTIVWDGITKACDFSISKFINFRGGSETKQDKKTGKDIPNPMMPAGQALPQIEDYKGELRFISECMDELMAINIIHNVNVIVMAHVLRTYYTNAKDKTVVDTKSLVSSGQKVGTLIPTLFGERFHFGMKLETDNDGRNSKKYICNFNDCIEEETGTPEWAGNSLGLKDPLDWTATDSTSPTFYEKFMKRGL